MGEFGYYFKDVRNRKSQVFILLLFTLFAMSPLLSFATAKSCLDLFKPATVSLSLRETPKLKTSHFKAADFPFVHDGVQGIGIHIVEDRYAKVNSKDSPVRLLFSHGIASCAALIIQDQTTGDNMFVHLVLNRVEFSNSQMIEKEVSRIQSILETTGSSLNNSLISIVWGPLGRPQHSERMTNLINSINRYRPQQILVDATTTHLSSRGVYVDTVTGQIYKQSGSPSIFGDTGPIEQHSGNIDRISWGTPLWP